MYHCYSLPISEYPFWYRRRKAGNSETIVGRAIIKQTYDVAAVVTELSAVFIDPTNPEPNDWHHVALLIKGLSPRDLDQRERSQIWTEIWRNIKGGQKCVWDQSDPD